MGRLHISDGTGAAAALAAAELRSGEPDLDTEEVKQGHLRLRVGDNHFRAIDIHLQVAGVAGGRSRAHDTNAAGVSRRR